jgi:hypothetical protein
METIWWALITVLVVLFFAAVIYFGFWRKPTMYTVDNPNPSPDPVPVGKAVVLVVGGGTPALWVSDGVLSGKPSVTAGDIKTASATDSGLLWYFTAPITAYTSTAGGSCQLVTHAADGRNYSVVATNTTVGVVNSSTAGTNFTTAGTNGGAVLLKVGAKFLVWNGTAFALADKQGPGFYYAY